MKEFKTKAGYIVYECTEAEIKKLFSIDNRLCDDCGARIIDEGYLVPARNVFLCIICYKDFCEKYSTYDETNREFENNTIKHYKELALKNGITIN